MSKRVTPQSPVVCQYCGETLSPQETRAYKEHLYGIGPREVNACCAACQSRITEKRGDDSEKRAPRGLAGYAGERLRRGTCN